MWLAEPNMRECKCGWTDYLRQVAPHTVFGTALDECRRLNLSWKPHETSDGRHRHYGRSIKLSGRHRCSLDTWNARCGRRLVVESFCIWWFGWNGNMDCGYWISKWIQAVSDEFIDEAYTSYLGGFTKRCIGITSVLIFRCIFILWCLIYYSMHYDFFVNTFIYSML